MLSFVFLVIGFALMIWGADKFVAGASALARKLGAPLENGRIVVNEKMQTGIPGLFAAGDCTGGMLQVCKAVHEGALAATEAVKLVRGQK